MLGTAREIDSYNAYNDAVASAYVEKQRRERSAFWDSVLGVVASVAANQIAAAAQPTYSGNAAGSPGYGAPQTASAYPGQSGPNGVRESVANNPANEAYSCIIAIDKNGYAAHHVSSTMGAVFRNSCGYSVQVTWCVVGVDCNPGYSNVMTVLGNSDRAISYDPSRPGHINWAACRNGFTKAQGELSRSLQHACT